MGSFCSLWHSVFFLNSYFLNNKKNLSSSIHSSLYFVLPKPLQNSLKTTSVVTRRSSRAAAVAPPPLLLRRCRCHFGLVDLTWVWSKVVVA